VNDVHEREGGKRKGDHSAAPFHNTSQTGNFPYSSAQRLYEAVLSRWLTRVEFKMPIMLSVLYLLSVIP